MAGFAADVDLAPHELESAARHLETTYHLRFGVNDKITELVFRQPAGSVTDPSPVSAALRALIGQFRAGGRPVRVTLGGLGKPDAVRLSELLRQTAERCDRRGEDGLARALRDLWAAYDRALRLPQDMLERADWTHYDGPVQRPRRAAAVVADESAPGWATAGPAMPDMLPPGIRNR